LDHVYAVLDEHDIEEMNEHLSVCQECQAALKDVQAEQELLASAARAITEVPEFAPPSDAPATIRFTQPKSPEVAGASRRPLWRRPWVGWTVAAGLLIAVSATISFYRHTVHRYESVLAKKRQEHKAAVERFASLPATYAGLQAKAVEELRGNAGPYLSVLGPTTLQPGAKAHLRIQAQHPEGTPRQVQGKKDFARIDLRVKVMDVASRKLHATNLKCDDDGRAEIELDAGDAAPDSKLQVIVEAKTAQGAARVEETVRIAPTSYVTRIDTNKIAYQHNDVLFFRAVVLDRVKLTPPADPIAMQVELVNPKGEAVRSLDLWTGAGGILGREFAIDDKLVEGQYSLRVRSLEAAKVNVQPAAQPLAIVRKVIAPEFRFDQEAYRAGDRVTGWFRGVQPLPSSATINNQAVPVTAATGKSIPNEKKKADLAQGERSQSFAVPLPADLPAGVARVPLTLQFADGMKRTAEIPLAPTIFAIDFFPEGGELVAGVPNRVFYRVRSSTGQAVGGGGQVILQAVGKNDIVDSTYKLGMGYFDFVPHPKESYTVSITTPTKVESVKDPFAKLGMRTDGVVMQIADLSDEGAPKAVGVQGEPIRVTLRQQGPMPVRKLLLLGECRGQIVDQRWVELKREPIDVTLQPTQEAVGMIRVTAYEKIAGKQGNSLQPVSERLVYRTPRQRLNLGFALDKQQLLPGPVIGKVTARNEQGQPAPAWLLASVVDERLQPRPRSLSAYFFVLNELRTGADIDQAEVVLHDSPEAVPMLERFLGTHGWRRFVRSDLDSAQGKGDAPAIFCTEAAPVETVQEQYEEEVARAVTPLRKDGEDKRIELENQCSELAQAVEAAASDLVAFEVNVQSAIRLTLGLFVIGLIGSSLILMGFGLYRILKTEQAATFAFGSAFACLIVCIGVYFLGVRLGPPDVPDPLRDLVQAPGYEAVREVLNAQVALLPSVKRTIAKPIAGTFALRAEAEGIGGKDAGQANVLSEQLAANLSRRVPGEGMIQVTVPGNADKPSKNANDNIALNKRFDEAKQFGKSNRGGSEIAPKPPLLPAAADKKPKMLAGAGREYFHQHVQNVLTDTLLWHPNLWLGEGQAEVRFDIGDGNATYRVLLLGHGPAGRFGFYETRLDVVGR
jgi:hypothetical protein